jgi:hypothetical protein
MKLDEEGFIQQRRLADGRTLAVTTIEGRARLRLGMKPLVWPFLFEEWEFSDIGSALLAFVYWTSAQDAH